MAPQLPEPDHSVYGFGRFQLLPSRQLLLRDGAPVRIGARAFDILTLLARRPGEIVSKTDLLKFGWPDTYVHESNLKVNVAALRRALRDGDKVSYIATVAGRGYRFVVPVAAEPAARGPGPLTANFRTLPELPRVIGRSGEIGGLAKALAGARCVTIVGPGGVGKTTVAVAVAHHVRASYPDGICFVDLSTVGDPRYATAAIAAGVGARQSSDDSLSEIIDALHDRRMLMILDNCEHLSPTVTAIVNRLLAASPKVTILATSREPLRAVLEHVHRLPTLDVPATDRPITAEEALGFGAVQLFVTRARERGAYVLSDADAPIVSAICQRLDGIALAIELAASKTNTLGVPMLLTMLEQSFLLLSNGERAAPLRQQTLMATLDWSYRLLSDGEATLLRLLSVFAGVFRMDDAVAMADAAGLHSSQTIDALERLTNRSIVCAEYHAGALRYRLLDSTRAYASARLAGAAEQDRALERHARHVLALFERAAEEWAWRHKRDWMCEYAGRVDDLRKALSWAFGPKGDRMLGVRLTAAAVPLWDELSAICESQSCVERALLALRDIGDGPADLMMKLVAARASGMSFAQHLAPDTETAWLDCYRLGVEVRNPEYQLHGLWGLAAHLLYVGRPLEAISRLAEFRTLAEAQADGSAMAEGERMLAMAETYIGQIGSARRRLERLAARHHEPREVVRFARFHAEPLVAIRCSYAFALWISGEPGLAMQVARSAVERAEITGHVVSHSSALAVCAIPIAFWTGDLQSTAAFLAAHEENGRREDIGLWRPMCRFFASALRAKRREPGAAAEMKTRLDELIAARNFLRAPMHYSMVAEALLDAGETGDARAVIEEAHSLAQAQVANWCLPETLRIAGLVELRSGSSAEAGRLLRRAVEKAEEIGALTLQLRAALALSGKLEADRCYDEACELLAASCAKFDDKADFADLAAARSRLQRLAREHDGRACHA